MEIKRNFLEDFPTFSELEKCIECGEVMFGRYDPCKYLNFINEPRKVTHDVTKEEKEIIYDFLISWGMQRVKPVSKDEFSEQIGNFKDTIVSLRDFSLIDFIDKAEEIRPYLENLYSGIKLTEFETKLVFFSKALHFLLPKLIIPMDRRHTITYLHKTNVLSDPNQEFEIFIAYHRRMAGLYKAYKQKLDELQTKFCPSKNYPITKLLDHAVIGCVRRKQNKCDK